MSGEPEGRVWVGMGWLDVYSVMCLGGVEWLGVYLVCVSVWLLLATSAPHREGEIPTGKGKQACWLLRSRRWGQAPGCH